MSNTHELLNLILEKTSAAEPVSLVRVLNDDGSQHVSVYWRNRFTPPIEDRFDPALSEIAAKFESHGGIADLRTIEGADGKQLRVVLEVVRPKLKLVIFGAGHVGQAAALIGAMLGYEVVVADDREEFASRRRFPDPRIGLLTGDMETAADRAGITAGTAIVIVTRGHQSDELCLKSVLRTPAVYLGMIGSKRRVLGVFKRLTAEGFTDEELARVHAPIGLKIGARTPQEIAVSILAEIISHVNSPKGN
jgi:xanthine dehydrogenase accessory factor